MDPTYPLFPIFAFLGFILALIPLSWHLQAWNSGTCFYMMWASLACLNQFVNSIVWARNALNVAPIWCEISIRIMLGASVGLPAASLCINRRLYYIASVQSVCITRSDKLRAILIDTLICLVFPLVFVALQYVVQGHRFNIFEDIGCFPALYNTLLTYFLSVMWPIVIGLISAVYCILTLRSFAQRRVEFGRFLASNKSLTISRYFRLMALAMTDLLFTTSLATFMMWLNITAGLGPWRSWADTHFDFGRVEEFPSVIWRIDRLTVVSMEFSRWVGPFCAIIFFVFFGFADEARKNYSNAFWWLAKRCGYHSSSTSSPAVLPIGRHKAKSTLPSSTAPSLPAYSPPSSSSLFSHEKKCSRSSTGSLTCTTHDTSTRSSDSYPPEAWSVVLYSEQSLLEGHDHDRMSKPPIAGSIV